MQTTLTPIRWAERRSDTTRHRRLDAELAELDHLTREAMQRRRAAEPDTEDYRQTDERVFALAALAGELRLQLDRGGRRSEP